jgi:histidinol-phosphate aminotransferase
MQHFLTSLSLLKQKIQVHPMNNELHTHILPKKNLALLSPYQATSSSRMIQQKPEQVPLKLDWNESTIIPSPMVSKAISDFLNQSNHLNWYPDLNSQDLVQSLSQFYTIPQEYFLVTNGSDEALHMLCASYLENNDRLVYAAPTYQHFLVFAQQEGADLIACHYPNPFQIDIELLIDTLHQHSPKMVYLVSPNNPTGVVYTKEDIMHLLNTFSQSLFVIDEAYMEFADTSCFSLVKDYHNLVITRTFSKAYGLAGCRIGYLMSHPYIIQQIKKIFSPKSVNVLAQVSAQAALKDQVYLKEQLYQVSQAQDMCVRELKSLGFTIHATPANFFMLKVQDADQWVEVLSQVGVYIRNRSHLESLKGYVRISVGTISQMEDFLQRIKVLLQNEELY